jgi:hypothetical protein
MAKQNLNPSPLEASDTLTIVKNGLEMRKSHPQSKEGQEIQKTNH